MTNFDNKKDLFTHAEENHPKRGAMPCPLHDSIFWDRKMHQDHVYQHYALLKEERKKIEVEKKLKPSLSYPGLFDLAPEIRRSGLYLP